MVSRAVIFFQQKTPNNGIIQNYIKLSLAHIPRTGEIICIDNKPEQKVVKVKHHVLHNEIHIFTEINQ